MTVKPELAIHGVDHSVTPFDEFTVRWPLTYHARSTRVTLTDD
jgi:hypothetical protein